MRDTVRRELRLTPATRLLVLRGEGLVDAAEVAELAHIAAVGVAFPCAVVADPCRLPFVAALFDTALVGGTDAALAAELREVWRVLAPAGVVVLVVRGLLGGLLDGNADGFTARRLTRTLADAMFEAAEVHPVAHHLIVRAYKTDGLAPLTPGPATPVLAPGRA